MNKDDYENMDEFDDKARHGEIRKLLTKSEKKHIEDLANWCPGREDNLIEVIRNAKKVYSELSEVIGDDHFALRTAMGLLLTLALEQANNLTRQSQIKGELFLRILEGVAAEAEDVVENIVDEQIDSMHSSIEESSPEELVHMERAIQLVYAAIGRKYGH